ncbi:SCO family protein, partial [Pseudomonas sp. DKN 2791]|uniref:SCO family protein n=1 Tax=Pseudomonas sp. DKN 2791 TaxID=3060956 RepID=UPI00267694CE
MSNTYRAAWGHMGQMRRCLLALLAAAALSATTIGPATAEWDESYFPNVELVNQDGVPLRFWDDLLRNKIVVVNFVYTECPDICGLSTARMAQVVDWLGER